MTKDLTSGNPFKIILLFTLPLMLGNLFQQFYSLADTIIVGRFVGVNALAAVGATGSVNYLMLGFVIGMCNGFAIPIAQLFGAHDDSDLRRHVANATWLCIAWGVVLTVVTVALTAPTLAGSLREFPLFFSIIWFRPSCALWATAKPRFTSWC